VVLVLINYSVLHENIIIINDDRNVDTGAVCSVASEAAVTRALITARCVDAFTVNATHRWRLSAFVNLYTTTNTAKPIQVNQYR